MVCFERDLIAERNKKEEIKSTVIKYWNVNYVDPEALRMQEEFLRQQEELAAQAAAQKAEEEAKLAEAQAIFERLEQERLADEAEKQAEIDQAYADAELAAQDWLDANYNETTGSFSGMYGQGEVDEVNKDQIAMILNEKDAAFRNMIEGGK